MLYGISKEDKTLPRYIDRNGRQLKLGDTFRMYTTEDELYGRPAILKKDKEHFVVDIPKYPDTYGLNCYFENAKGSGWDTFEIVNDYPNAEPYK